MSNDPFVNTPPTKPGWYWCRYRLKGPNLDLDWDRPLVTEFHPDVDQGPIDIRQWDPTPIPGPGELRKMVKEAYEEGAYDYFDSLSTPEELWEKSRARAALERNPVT